MWQQTIVFCAVLAVAFSALAIGPLLPKPEKFKDVEGCFIDELDSVIPFGKAAPSKSGCMEYRCLSDSINYASCGVAFVKPPCKLIEEKEKPYPECCPKISC